MAITYDKKALKRLHKQVKNGKKQFVLKRAFFFRSVLAGFYDDI